MIPHRLHRPRVDLDRSWEVFPLMLAGAFAYALTAFVALLVVELVLWPLGYSLGFEAARWIVAVAAGVGAGFALGRLSRP